MNKQLICFCLGLLLIGSVYGQETIERTFEGIKEIDVSLGSGDATFEKGTGDEVRVVLKHTFDDYQPTIEKRGDKLVVREERKNGNWSRNGSSSWTFSVPDGMELDFNTGSGDVSMASIEMEVEVNSGSGDFELSRVTGEFKMNTGSGDIDIRGGEGRYRMNTGSGDIELSDVSAEVEANTGSGDIEADDISLAGPSSLNSGSGDVEVGLAGGLDYDISVNSGSGDAILDFNGAAIEGEIVMEANKRNGRIVAPFEFDNVEELDNGGSSKRVRKTVQLGDKDIRIRVSSGSGTAKIEE